MGSDQFHCPVQPVATGGRCRLDLVVDLVRSCQSVTVRVWFVVAQVSLFFQANCDYQIDQGITNMNRFADVSISLFVAMLVCLFAVPRSASAWTTRHPVSIVEAEIYVNRLQTTVRLTCFAEDLELLQGCLLYTSPSPRDRQKSRMPSSA